MNGYRLQGEIRLNVMTRVARGHGRGRDSDTGVAMLTVILLMMVCAAFSVLMLGVVISQVKPTVFAAKNARTISAAEAGVDATLSQLRTATSVVGPDILGDPTKLPCSVAGFVGGASATARYEVAITYFDESPADQNAIWRNANKLNCVNGSGVSVSPSFALIASTGRDDAVAGYAATVGDRTFETIYTFKVTNANVDGGVIYNWGRLHCLSADGLAVGAKISYVLAADCQDGPRNLWSYKTDYTIRLSITDFVGATNPLCLTGRPATSGGVVSATIETCNGATNQKWAWHDGARFYVVNSDGKYDDTFCLSAGSEKTDLTAQPALVNNWCAGNVPSGAFDPDPRVGAGAAGKAKDQVVSFLEFGRCFDVTDTQVDKAFMILYPCKQAPGTLDVLAWNHRWYYNEPAGSLGKTGVQKIRVSNGTDYCLNTPALLADPAYVTLKKCSLGGVDLNWIRSAQSDTYADSWIFTDRHGRCISVGTKSPETVSMAWSTMVVADCTGGPEQKWNAPKLDQSSALGNFKELY